jgi:hypothetical protein
MARKRNKLRAATRLKLQQIVRLYHAGKGVEEIAMLLGETIGNVTDLTNHQEYRKLEAEYADKLYKPVDSMLQQRNAQRIMEDVSPDAAEALAALLFDEDPTERRRAATAILDRSGHGPIQRRAILKRLELDPVSAKLLSEAMKDAVVEEIEAEVVND